MRRCEKIGICHAERSEASAFSLKTNECRSFAPLRMTARVDFFTPSEALIFSQRKLRFRYSNPKRPQRANACVAAATY
jgi:hypothetical protein